MKLIVRLKNGRERAGTPVVRPEDSKRRKSWLAAIPKQYVLRGGFATIIALLIFAAVQANRIHDSVSRQTAETYHRYAKQQEVLSDFRRNLLLGNIYARDFFLNPWAHRTDQFKSQLQYLKNDLYGELDQIEHMPGMKRAADELRARASEYLETLSTITAYTDESMPDFGFEFVERDVAAKRKAAHDLATDLIADNQAHLNQSEAEFAQGRRTATRRLYLMLGGCLFIGLGVAVFSVIYAEALERRSARQYEDVMQAKRDLQALSARLLEVQEQERKHFSRELHDEIGQSLTALRMEISHVQLLAKELPRRLQERLEKARELAEGTIRAVRDISLLLRPSILDDLGLGPALEYQVEEFMHRTGIRCELEQDGLSAGLSDATKTCVYRVVQEALHNCQKHAGATSVRVAMRQSDNQLEVEIRDDGRGFDQEARRQAQHPAGLGLLGMRERVEMLGGTLDISSAPGSGTRLSLRIPVEVAEPARTAEEVSV